MKKLYIFIVISLLLITGCKNFRSFALYGELSNLKSDTILVVYQEPELKLDTIIAKKGKFEYKAPIDSFSIFSLIVDHNVEIPIFADKGEHVSLKGDTKGYSIDGFGDNKKMNDIFSTISTYKNDTAKIQSWSEKFIKENSSSYSAIYLIKKYFVENSNLDINKINKILSMLHGSVKDSHYMILLQENLDSRINSNDNMYVSSIGMPDDNGSFLPWDLLSNKYSLISFWASWDRESKKQQDSLSTVLKEFPKDNFQLVSVSLDYDKNQWKQSIPQKDKRWKHACDFRAWDNNLVKQQNITDIPYYILLSPDKKVISRNSDYKKILNFLKTKIK